jgi:hypothetical protein
MLNTVIEDITTSLHTRLNLLKGRAKLAVKRYREEHGL